MNRKEAMERLSRVNDASEFVKCAIKYEIMQDEPDKEMLNILNKTLELLIRHKEGMGVSFGLFPERSWII